MVSNEKSSAEEELQKWLENNSVFSLDASEKIEKVVFLTGTIKSDPRALSMGIEFDHKYEIQPKVVFSLANKSGKKEIGIIEISSSPIGLKDVGILHTYAKIINPKYALLLCQKSFSKELTYLLTDPKIGPRLMVYSQDRTLQLLDFN
jgi:hypothetical protein